MRWCCGYPSIAPASSVEPAEPPLITEQRAEKKNEAEPPLTAEQLAEKKQEEAELIAAQLAKPSYWDEVGPDKPNASALKAALADTVLVDAAWLARLADEGGILPRCQDLPPGARVTLEEMEKWRPYGSGTLGVLVISYPWWAPPALDPLHSSAMYSPCCVYTLLMPCRPWRTGSTPTTPTRTGCSCARSQRC